MDVTHHKNRKLALKNEPDMANKNMPDWFKIEMENLSTKLEKLNNQIASIPVDSSLGNLRAMMKETAKALQIKIDELDELTHVMPKPPTHKMTSSKKD